MDNKPKKNDVKMKEVNEKDKKEEIIKQNEEEQTDKLQYKQLILIVLLTVIMVLVSLGLSFSIIRLLDGSKNMNFNTIMIPITPIPEDPKEPGKPSKPPVVDKDDFIFSYKEKETLGNGILIENMLPTTDEVGRALVGDYNTFEFTLYFGKKSKNRYYEITAEMLNNCTLDSKYVKIYLESDEVVLDNVLRSNGRIKVFSEYSNATINKNNSREKVIHSGNITKDDVKRGYKNFTLKMWFSEDAPLNDQTMNKMFAVRINVYAK